MSLRDPEEPKKIKVTPKAKKSDLDLFAFAEMGGPNKKKSRGRPKKALILPKKSFPIRADADLIGEIDSLLDDGLSRNMWIIKAIKEKLVRERKKNN